MHIWVQQHALHSNLDSHGPQYPHKMGQELILSIRYGYESPPKKNKNKKIKVGNNNKH